MATPEIDSALTGPKKAASDQLSAEARSADEIIKLLNYRAACSVTGAWGGAVRPQRTVLPAAIGPDAAATDSINPGTFNRLD